MSFTVELQRLATATDRLLALSREVMRPWDLTTTGLDGSRPPDACTTPAGAAVAEPFNTAALEFSSQMISLFSSISGALATVASGVDSSKIGYEAADDAAKGGG